MLPLNMLKKNNLFYELPDKDLKLFQPFTEVAEYNEKEIIYQKDQPAHNIFTILHGKALLEENISEDISVSYSSLKPGYSFGWNSLIPESAHNHTAVSAEPSKIMIMSGEKFRNVLHKTPHLCYTIMLKIFEIFKYRLDHRTAQFVSLLSKHPDMEQILEDRTATGQVRLTIEGPDE